MSKSGKKGQFDEKVLEDRLSNLPRHLIDSILEHLPLNDVARTCVLSKTWLNIWEFHPRLVFDTTFFSQPSNRDNQEIVNMILLCHTGPILKFHLYIPSNLNNPFNTPLISAWIKNVSAKGIRNLKLINADKFASLQMPSSLFSCSHLTNLSLTDCILNPPRNFGGFPNLIKVELVNVSITADMTFGSQVVRLYLTGCTGIEHLGCQFTDKNSLCTLTINGSKVWDWRWFEFTRSLHTFFLFGFNPVFNMRKSISLEKVLVNMPHIHMLGLCDSTLECLEPGPKRLATTMENLVILYFHDLGLYEFGQISNALCLIRSSPNLKYLIIQLKHVGMNSAVESYLTSPDCMDIILHQLQIIKISAVTGSRAELHLIKFLLASSPALRTVTLQHDSTISDHKTELEIAKELMGLPRASSAAQMIWT